MPDRRQTGVMLPEDPGEEELARDWTLSEADHGEVLRCRGDDNRRRFAIQLCVLRQYGTFLDRYAAVPVRILNHLNRQLGLSPVPKLAEVEREATETGHQQRIREYLKFRTFDEEARQLLEEHLRARLAQGAWPEDRTRDCRSGPRARIPLMHTHVIPNGTYRFGDEEESDRYYAAAS